MHLIRPEPFRAIVPPVIPRSDWVVFISGVAEIMGGLGILIGATRPAARWGLFALLAVVFPANVYMAQNHIEPQGVTIQDFVLWARLPLQPLLMWWVLAATREDK
jgi:uncharacterized membrane protein